MQRFVRVFSALLRYLPTDNGLLRKFVMGGSAVFDKYQFDFTFYCPRIHLRWSMAGHPEELTKHLLFEGYYQIDVIKWIQRLAPRGGTVFDVGAHHGLMSVIAGKAVGASGVVVSFEPHTGSRQLLAAHVRLNRLANVRIESVGVMDASRTFQFYPQAIKDSWNSSFVREFVDHSQNIQPTLIPCTTLDHYVEEHGLVPHLLKIDTEGTEFRVLQGALSLIRKHRPAMILELNPSSAEAAGTSVPALMSQLQSLGYSLWTFPWKRYGGYRFSPVPYTMNMQGADGGLVNVACIARQ